MQVKNQFCKVPEFLEFQYYSEQQLHAFIDLENLTDEIISFKIKTNAPAEYLVKPMEGQIYKKDKIKIIFKRKKIPQQHFQAIQSGDKTFKKEKFQFIIKRTVKNAIGIQKIQETMSVADVRFVNPKKSLQENFPVKKQKRIKTNQERKMQAELLLTLNIEKNRLQELKMQKQMQQSKYQNMQSTVKSLKTGNCDKIQSLPLSKQNIICLVLLFLILGMWL